MNPADRSGPLTLRATDDGILLAQGATRLVVLSATPVADAVIRAARGAAESASLCFEHPSLAAAFALGRAVGAGGPMVSVSLPQEAPDAPPSAPSRAGDAVAEVPDPAVAAPPDAPPLAEATSEVPDPAVAAPPDAPPLAEVTAEPVAAPPDDAVPLATRLHQAEQAVLWHGHASPEARQAIAAVEAHPEASPDTAADLAACVARATAQRAGLEALKLAARRLGPDHPETIGRFESLLQEFPGAAASATKALEHERNVRARHDAGPSRVQVRPNRPHRLTDLAPSRAWRVFIDETGEFRAGGGGKLGRVVAVVVGDAARLPPLSTNFHAADATFEACDRAMQALLDAPEVGVFGLTVGAAPRARVDPWVVTVLETLHWVLRLLPIRDDAATRVTVEVEARGEHRNGDLWLVPAQQMLRELVDRAPGRFGGTELSVQIRGKYRLDPRHPYADLVAHAWSQRSDESKTRLRASGLRGPCLVDGDARAVKAAWDELDGQGRLRGDTWLAAMAEPSADAPESVLGGVLAALAERCRGDAGVWQTYVDACARELDGKAVRVGRLGRFVGWLEACRPADASPLNARLELAWLTAKFEAENHAGATHADDEARLETLALALYDEAPSLVCQADLDRAVRATNRFDFDQATRCLARWKAVSPAVPGLQLWARVQSSLGQHAAFVGDAATAELYFEEALSAFERLSDPTIAAGERAQTGSYRALAAMDAEGIDPARLRSLIEVIVPLDEDALEALARDDSPARKYAHHLAARWLVQHGTPAERRAYLRGRPEKGGPWKRDAGHPWPLIDAYRGILLRESGHAPAGVQAVWEAAVRGATGPDQGPTEGFIGLVLASAAAAAGCSVGRDTGALETSLRRELPRAPWAALETARAESLGPLETLRRVLPFNFR